MSHATEPLSADTTAKLLDLARACKAAARVVSMYPPTHPAIVDALARITAAGTAAVADGPFQIAVTPDALMVGGRALLRPDIAASELAAMLHAHSVGELSLQEPLTPAAWHAFLMLISQSPADVRGEGGIARAWEAAGGGPLVLRQIDYAEVLRERPSGEDSSWAAILTAYLAGEQADVGDAVMAALSAIAVDPARMDAFVEGIVEKAAQDGWSTTERARLAKLLQSLATYVAKTAEDDYDRVMRGIANSVPKMSPELVSGLLHEPPPVDADGAPAGVDLAAELRVRLDDEIVARFVAGAVVRERTASARLAEAFQSLVPDDQQRGRVLDIAEGVAAEGPFGQDPMFVELWHQASEMLQSYTDEKYISDAYANDLSMARAAAVELERIDDDPPERVAAWMATVSDEQVRRLDQQVLGDLLVVEIRPEDWRKIHALALARIEQLVLAGDLPPAQELLDTLIRLSREVSSPVAEEAGAGVARLAAGEVVTHILLFVRQAEEAELPRATRFCLSLGKSVAGRLVDALLVEENARTIRRLREVLLAFGSAAKGRITELCTSTNPAVRRTAVELLRAFGSADALPHLIDLLDDDEAQVQRDALRAVMHIGSDDAFTALQRALTSGPARTREMILQSVGALRDQRAAPLFAFIVRQGQYRGALEPVYLAALKTLGHLGVSSDVTLGALEAALGNGEWWAPFRTRRIHDAAASALRAIGTPAALALLRAAATAGSRSGRAAASAALASVPAAAPASIGGGSGDIPATDRADAAPAAPAPPSERSSL